MPALTEVFWNDALLKGGVQRARKIALGSAAAVAQAKNPAPRHIHVIPISGTFGPDMIKGTGQLAPIMEGGRRGGYPIQPGLHTLAGRATSTHTTATGRFIQGHAAGAYGVRGSSHVAIKFTHGDGGFAAGSFLGGAMAARPFLAPAADFWVHGGFQAALSASLATTGIASLGIAA